MTTITAQHNQSMIDLVLSVCGTPEGAVAFCLANEVAISDTPVPGQVYIVPDGIIKKKEILRKLADGRVTIGTLAAEPVPIPEPLLIMRPYVAVMAISTGPGWQLQILPQHFLIVNGYSEAFAEPTHPIKVQTITDYIAMNLPSTLLAEPSVPEDEEVLWNSTIALPSVGVDKLLIWSEMPADHTTTEWTDTTGNRAIYAPVMLLDAALTPQVFIHDASAALVSEVSGVYTVRLTKYHGSTAGAADFNLVSSKFLIWNGVAYEGLEGVEEDANNMLIELEAGTYEIAVSGKYENDAGTVEYPESLFSIVITLG